MPSTFLLASSVTNILSALPLLLTPTLTQTLLAKHPLQTDPPALTNHLLRSYGFNLLVLAVLTACVAGWIPLSSTDLDANDAGASAASNPTSGTNPDADTDAIQATPNSASPSPSTQTLSNLTQATTLLATLFHTAALISSYVHWSTEGGGGIAVGWSISAVLSAWGLLSLVFSGSKERGSGFMFPDEGKRGRKEEKWRRRFGGRKIA